MRIKEPRLKEWTIKDRNLATQLEQAAADRGGFLTYSELWDITQHGEYGFHANHDKHGAQTTYNRWAHPIAKICGESGINQVVEFGSGDGSLGVEIAKAAQSRGVNLDWSGIEIVDVLKERTYEQFEEQQVLGHLRGIFDSIQQIPQGTTGFYVFSYSLDSIPPEVFISLNDRFRVTHMLGYEIEGSTIKEIILDDEQLKSTGFDINDTVLSTPNGTEYDLENWRIAPGNRSYIPVHSMELLTQVYEQAGEGSHFLIVDEFFPKPASFNVETCWVKDNVSPPNRDYSTFDMHRSLLYHTFQLNTLNQVLLNLGFETIRYDEENRYAANLIGLPPPEQFRPRGMQHYENCFAVLAQNKDQQNQVERLPLFLGYS